MSNPTPIDNPISSAEQDTLGRRDAATAFAREVLGLPYSEGLVVGVLGPWGFGKTSFLNLAREEWICCGSKVIDFNPWLFSGADQLVAAFFETLADEALDLKLNSIAAVIRDYGGSLTSFGGIELLKNLPYVSSAVGAVETLTKLAEKPSLSTQRKKLQAELRKLTEPLFVIIDDIDRLEKKEIREIFKLVRLTASFPNIIYVLAFDRNRVEKALADDDITGHDYLEKILQLAYDLPAVSPETLRAQTLTALQPSLPDMDDEDFNSVAWHDVYPEVVQPLIRSMRDVRRYTTAVSGSVAALKGKVEIVDVLALEAVRIFLPGVFQKLHANATGLTGAWLPRVPGEQAPTPIEELLRESNRLEEKIVRSVIRRLFPAEAKRLNIIPHSSASHWDQLKNRRVAHESILRRYLERVADRTITDLDDARRVVPHLANRANLEQCLAEIPADRLTGVVYHLTVFESEFKADQVVPGVIVLSNLADSVPRSAPFHGAFDLGWSPFDSTIRCLILSPKDAGIIERCLTEAILQIPSLTSQLELIEIVDRSLSIPVERIRPIQRRWRDDVRALSLDHLFRLREWFRILVVVTQESGHDEPRLELTDTLTTTVALLRGAISIASGTNGESRVPRRGPRLRWKLLVTILGEQNLKDRLQRLEDSQPQDPEVKQLLALAARYPHGDFDLLDSV